MIEQEIGNQVARQREEDAHPEHPAFGPRSIDVVGDHAEDRDCAQPIETRNVTLAAFDWPGHD
jgi:hypothetical protein